MDAAFHIELKPEASLVHINLTGFFSENDVIAFSEALSGKIAALGGAPNHHVTLCDITGMKIQAQDTVAAFTQLVGGPTVRSRKLAFVYDSSLARQQAMRLTDRPGVRFFKSATEAEAWLCSTES